MWSFERPSPPVVWETKEDKNETEYAGLTSSLQESCCADQCGWKDRSGVDEISSVREALTSQPFDLSLFLTTHIVGGESQRLQLVLWLAHTHSECAQTDIQTRAHAHTCIRNKQKHNFKKELDEL